MRPVTILFFAVVVMVGCSPKESEKEKPETQIHFIQYSESVKDTFYIDIQLPKNYFEKPDKKYPVAVLVDGNFYFPMLAPIVHQYAVADLMKSVIMVGIGYKSFQMMDSLRVRDYLYPKALPSDELVSDGGGQEFYNFITKELIPKIDTTYRTEKNKRALLGHSLGGYFVLYSLLHQLETKKNDFKIFISACPSLWYNNFYLKRLPDQLSKGQDDLDVLMSVGGNEDPTWSIKPFEDLSNEIRKKNIKGLKFQSRVHNHLNHMDVPVLSFTMGLQEAIK